MEREAQIRGSVLFVEDDDTTRGAIAASLARRVETLYLAENGRMGLELFSRLAPHVVVTDITMPSMDGLTMAREIKRLNPAVPVIVTTAYSDTQYLIDAIDIGVDSYVLKPVEFGKLFAAVRRHLAFVDHLNQAARHQEEQRTLLEQLQAAAREITTLSSLLPICANCRKIRDDAGHWTHLERYISEHAHVAFSHGICPACIETLYPDLGGRGPAGT